VAKDVSAGAASLQGQPMFKLIDRARKLEEQGVDVIHLEIGDPDFDTPDNIKQAAINSIRQGETHYVSSWGLPELIDAVKSATQKSRGFTPDINQVLVTPGANIGIFYTIFCVANSGDEVLVPDPGFPTYLSALAMCGVKPVPYQLNPQDSFRVNVAEIERRITSKTRMIILTSPNNPTGSMLSKDELESIFKLAEKHDIFIYSDEIYSRMVYEKNDFYSISELDECRQRVILANGFSKAFAMTGWRLGVLVAPKDLAEKMMLLLQTTSSCVSPFIQRAGAEAIVGDQRAVEAMMLEYRRRRDFLVDGLNSVPGVKCEAPRGAFYAFADISSFGLSSADFASKALQDCAVALLPGTDFGPNGEGFVRMSFASAESRLGEAIDRLKEFCGRLQNKNV
jgi:aspartate/methionine/tyrosine aminotransferase